MRKRLSIDGEVLLKDRAGTTVGRLTSITVELYGDEELADAAEAQPALPGAPDDPVAEVWQHYVAVIKPRHVELDPQARAVIRDALKVASLDECKRAIDGCRASDFHMGQNERRRKYNRITHILKGKRGTRTTREQIDLFLDIAEKRSAGPGVASGSPARINEAKRDVLTAYEFANDEHAARRGREARQWLEGQGWRIEAGEDGWPSFRPPSP